MDGAADAENTEQAFPVALQEHRFRVRARDGTTWSTLVMCSPFHPEAEPQVVRLQREPSGFAQGIVRGQAEEGRAPSLVVTSGSRPGAQTVVYVHGIGNKPIASILKCQWDRALFGSEMGDRTRMAYWVDRERYPRPLDATCGQPDRTATDDDEATTATIMGLSVPDGPQAGAGREDKALEREIAAMASTDAGGDAAGRRRQLEAIARSMVAAADQPLPDEATERLAERGRLPGVATARVLPLPPGLRQMLTRLLTRVFLRDVNEFLFDDAKRQAMTDALWDRLRGGGEPFVVVAHSQGSMVAYDLLRRLRAEECRVELLVTIGSPLGLKEVQDYFTRDGQRLATPACVARWLNVADRLDPVAFDPTLRGEFAASGPGNEVVDVNDWGLNPDSPRSPHSASGYLRTAPVRDVIRAVLGNAFAQFVAGSVVARDVAARAEDAGPDALHDVLIQLADPDDDRPPRPLAEVAGDLVKGLRGLAAQRPPGLPFDPPDVMRRFVQARLTRAEMDGLRTLSARLGVKQVWANARKRGLLNLSAATVQAPTANIGYRATGRDVTWAVLDTGIDWNHPHFAAHGNVRFQWDCLGSGEPRPMRHRKDENADPNGHGTHVAGIICGTLDNLRLDDKRVTLSGMAPEATLYGFRVLDERAEGSDAGIIKALDKIASINEASNALVIHGVNLSLGANFDPRIFGVGHTPLCQELRRLWRQGVLVCVAAGNEGYAELRGTDGYFGANMGLSIGDPANLEEAIAVGSVHRERPHTYGVSYFSSRGPTADGRRKPDVVAPGEKILSVLAGAATKKKLAPRGVAEADDWYVQMSGTSAATPHVSGILAAFLSVRREFIGEPDRVKRILLDGCTDLGREPNAQGAGLVNLVKMLVAT